MTPSRAFVFSLVATTICAASLPAQPAPPIPPSVFGELTWRNIGPFRAGRTKAAAGHPS